MAQIRANGSVIMSGLNSSEIPTNVAVTDAGAVQVAGVDINFQYVLPYLIAGAATDAYTAAGNGTTASGFTFTTWYAIQVVGTGAAATSWDVKLEASIDGVNFTTVITHTQVDLDGTVKWSGANHFPAPFFRSRCAAVVLGGATDITVYVYGTY